MAVPAAVGSKKNGAAAAVDNGWTVTQVRQLFPQPLDDTRYEIIGGVLHVSRQPDWQHQLTTGNVGHQLTIWSRATGSGICFPAPGVIFSEDEAVAPDYVWVSNDRRAEVLTDEGHLQDAPDLVVEVLSPGTRNRKRDRQTKLDLYSRRAVREYWILDWRKGSVEVFRREGGSLKHATTLQAEDTLESPLLPGFSCRVAEFFDGVR